MRSKLLKTVRYSETRGCIISNDGNALTSQELRLVADAANAHESLLAACEIISPERFELLAKWLDMKDWQDGRTSNEVQFDLRRMAAALRQLNVQSNGPAENKHSNDPFQMLIVACERLLKAHSPIVEDESSGPDDDCAFARQALSLAKGAQ